MSALLGLLAQVPGTPAADTWGLLGLGVIAAALVVGATISYRWVGLPERTRADANQARADEAYKLCLPLVEKTTSTQDRLLALLPDIERALRAEQAKRPR